MVHAVSLFFSASSFGKEKTECVSSQSMGHAVYICPVPTKEALQSAIQDLKLHDSTSFEEVRLLSNAEFIDLDPDRAKFFLELLYLMTNGRRS